MSVPGVLAFARGVFFGESVVEMSLAHVINDVFMAVFFLLVGLEVKYELTVGELTNIRQALLPIMAAVGGVLAPIAIYLVFNATNPETVQGWGAPPPPTSRSRWALCRFWAIACPTACACSSPRWLSPTTYLDSRHCHLLWPEPQSAVLAAAVLVTVLLIVLNRTRHFSLRPILFWACCCGSACSNRVFTLRSPA